MHGTVQKMLFLLLSTLILSLFACKSSTVEPKEPNAPTINDLVHSAKVKMQLPGIAVAVVTPNSILLAVDGIRKLGDTLVITPLDLYHLGSNTKAFTAMLAARAVEEGKLQWETRVVDVIPDLKSSMLPAYENVTLEDLLRHRSGLPAFTGDSEATTIPDFQGTVMDQRLQATRWVFGVQNIGTPGKDYNYSNAGYIVAATMIESVLNHPYEDLLPGLILQPMGLQAKFGWPAANDPNQPWGHNIESGVLKPVDPNTPENSFPTFATPAGNMSINIGDYAKFLQINLKAMRGSPAVLCSQSYTKLLTPVSGYGMGWVATSLNGKPMLIHDGTAGSFFALAAMDTNGDRAVAVLVNAMIPGLDTGLSAMNELLVSLYYISLN